VDDRIAGLEAKVEQLRSALLAIQHRLDLLEAKGFSNTTSDTEDRAQESADIRPEVAPLGPDTRDWRDPIVVLSLIGRLVLVLAGGFFLRAMTDSAVLAPPVGVTLGFTYGLVWLFLTDRVGERGHVPSAVFHALAAAMVAFPLLLEATTRFKVLSGATSALAIAVLTAGLLFVAWRRRLHAVAWVTVVVAVPTSIVILVQTGVVVPFALYLIALGVATLWMGYSLDWWALRWPVALAADVVVLGVTLRALAPERQDTPHVAMLVQLALLGAYVVSIAIRTLVRGRNVIPFEVVQTAAALVVGFGGAVSVTRATGTLPTSLGVASLVCGAACYSVAFAFLDRREDHEWNVFFYTTLALVLVMAGFRLVLGEQWLSVVFAVLAVLAAGLWSRLGRLFTLLHGAAYLMAAGLVSDTLRYCAGTLAAGAAVPWILPSAVMLVVLVAGALSAGLVALQPKSDVGAFAGGPRFVIIVVFVWVAGGCVVGYLAPVAAGLADRAVEQGMLATIRTGVLAMATLLIAWIGRHARFREWGWLVYPLLVGIGLKMVAQDFVHSRPATLFIAMALYGTALIVAPRLRRGSATFTASSRGS
jgi:hypothetical protein